MKNKRWTPKTEITESLLRFREKRKWQIALRRYVLEKQKTPQYAPYFGISIEGFRNWIQLQFDEQCTWENFGETWQFDHIVPLSYFDFGNDTDLKLCWNFINIHLEKVNDENEQINRIDIIAAKPFFEHLYEQTGYQTCKGMVEKIERIEISRVVSNEKLEGFIRDRKEELESYQTFSTYEYDQINSGTAFTEILAERKLLKKFGK